VKDTIFLILVVILFFGLVLHAIGQDERRKADRRQTDLPVPVERRKGNRRGNNVFAYLAWGLRNQVRKIMGDRP
jgi:hypothetical protein